MGVPAVEGERADPTFAPPRGRRHRDAGQYEKLLEMSCKRGQGFLFAKPLDPGAFETFVRVGGAKMALEVERLAIITPGR